MFVPPCPPVEPRLFEAVRGAFEPGDRYYPHTSVDWDAVMEFWDADLRVLVAAAEMAGHKGCHDEVAAYLGFGDLAEDIPVQFKWPLFAEHPAVLEEALGIRPDEHDLDWEQGDPLGQALTILGAFPVIPASYLPRLQEIARDETDPHHRQAQQMLDRQAR